ncbi:MAG: hypothetical protein WBB28_04640 [Crinalium sp.]
MSTFLSGTAVTLSILALIASGFAVYQVFEIRQNINPAGNLEKIAPPTPNKTSLNQSPQSSSDDNNPATANPSPKASAASVAISSPKTKPLTTTIKPGQFVQPALTNQAQVELLSVKRIEDPQTGNRDVVNVQMRIRSQANDLKKPTYIEIGQTTARNPNTSETYKPVDSSKHSTEKVDISQIAKGASADAYVWLRLPEKVSTLDIFVPKTAQFNQVPVSQ